MAQLSDQQLQTLRDNYARIERINPDSANYKQLTAKLSQYPQEVLKQLAGANIKFVSSLARNRLRSAVKTEDASPSRNHMDVMDQMKQEINQNKMIANEADYKRAVRQMLIRRPVVPAAQVEQFTRRFMQQYPYSQYRIQAKTGDMRTAGMQEARKLLQTQSGGKMTAKVYRDSETNEFVVKFYVDGVYQTEADYFTDDKQDAMDTARSQVNRNRTESVKEADEIDDEEIKSIEKEVGADEENPRDIEKEVPSDLDLEWISKFDLGEIKEAIQKIIDHLSETEDEEQIELLRNDIRILDNLHSALGKKDSAAVDKYWKIAKDEGSHEHLHPEFSKRMDDVTALVNVKEGYVTENVTYNNKAKWDKAAKKFRVKASGKSETAYCKETGQMMGRWSGEKGWLESC